MLCSQRKPRVLHKTAESSAPCSWMHSLQETAFLSTKISHDVSYRFPHDACVATSYISTKFWLINTIRTLFNEHAVIYRSGHNVDQVAMSMCISVTRTQKYWQCSPYQYVISYGFLPELLEVKKKVLIGHTGKAQVPGKSKGASDFKQISDNVSKALLLPTHHRVW